MSWLAKPAVLRRAMNCWPPFWGAGISVRHISDDWQTVIVRMRQHFYNRNNFGTHFGGSLFSMTDPFHALMLLHNLDSSYWVWDKAGEIEFIRPGEGTVTATFNLDPETVRKVELATAGGDKHFEDFAVDVLNAQDEVVARVAKKVYVRKKPGARSS